MALIETLRKSAELRDNTREQQLLEETDAERNQRILRQKMRVYSVRSLANKTRTATTSQV